MLTLILIVNFQARLTQELESQTQQAASSGAEVDEHEVTRRVLGERRGHQRAVGKLLKGARSSFATIAASHAYFTPGSSSVHPTYEKLATARADLTAARAETQRYKKMLDFIEMNMAHLVAQLQSRIPDIQFSSPVPQYTQPGLNAEGDEEEEVEDQNLGDD